MIFLFLEIKFIEVGKLEGRLSGRIDLSLDVEQLSLERSQGVWWAWLVDFLDEVDYAFILRFRRGRHRILRFHFIGIAHVVPLRRYWFVNCQLKILS